MDRFENLLWHYITTHVEDESELEKVKARLWKPPPGEAAEYGPWSAEAEMEAFASLSQAVGGNRLRAKDSIPSKQ